jgi:hypothetical protein
VRPRARIVVAVALATVLSAREASGEIYRIKSPSTVVTEKGSTLKLPPGYFLDEEAWRERDERLKQAENDRTRLKAENQSLRKSAGDYPWVATGVVGAFGVALGVFLVVTSDRW